jgi:hypothetical protein
MTPTAATAPTQTPRRSRPGAVAMALAVIAALLLTIGGALVTIHLTQRDDDGYFSSSIFRLAAHGYAITSQQLDLAGGGRGNLARDAAQLRGSLRIQARSSDGKPIFVGIARQFDADRYLDGVARDEVVDAAGAATTTVTHPGRMPAGTPTHQAIWQASATGTGPRTMTWRIRPGRWTVAIMHADASKGVQAQIATGLKTRLFLWIGLASLAGSLLTAGAAAFRAAAHQKHDRA